MSEQRVVVQTEEVLLMDVTATSIADVVVLKLAGEFKTRTDIADVFWANFNRGTSKFILNFEKVSAVNSVGLQTLIELHRLTENAGGGLRITRINELIARVFKASNMDKILKLYDDEDLALVSLMGGLPVDTDITPISRYQH